MKNFTVYAIGDEQLESLMDLPGYSHSVECSDRYVGGYQCPKKARKVHFKCNSYTSALKQVRESLGFRPWPEHHMPRYV